MRHNLIVFFFLKKKKKRHACPRHSTENHIFLDRMQIAIQKFRQMGNLLCSILQETVSKLTIIKEHYK